MKQGLLISSEIQLGLEGLQRIHFEHQVGGIAQVLSRHALDKVSMTHHSDAGFRSGYQPGLELAHAIGQHGDGFHPTTAFLVPLVEADRKSVV